MPFAKKPQVFGASINALTLGTGDKAITLGGQNVYNLYTFDAPIANRPKIGIDVSDDPQQPSPGLAAFYEGCTTLADLAKKAASLEDVDFVCIRFDLADPNGADKSIEDCVADAKAVAEVVDKPIVVAGCKNTSKDTELFGKVSEALQGKNILVLSAREEDYKGVAASAVMAYGQKVGAESAVDINLAKQLNVLISQMGVPAGSVVMNVGSAGAGYGFEYVSSTLDRVKAAALAQNDNMLQMPIITPISTETWGLKESIMPESEMPEWGPAEERGIEMEITTAAACLAGGSDAVILAHPASIAAVTKMINALV